MQRRKEKPFYVGKPYEYKEIKFTFYGCYGKAVRVELIPYQKGFSDYQKIFIPLKHFDENGNLKGDNINYCFAKRQHVLSLAGYTQPIIGIKRRTSTEELEQIKQKFEDEKAVFK